jgi:hypothetical protein
LDHYSRKQEQQTACQQLVSFQWQQIVLPQQPTRRAVIFSTLHIYCTTKNLARFYIYKLRSFENFLMFSIF